VTTHMRRALFWRSKQSCDTGRAGSVRIQYMHCYGCKLRLSKGHARRGLRDRVMRRNSLRSRSFCASYGCRTMGWLAASNDLPARAFVSSAASE
jgi:uncharacterized protein with PIN domain